ncbi:MAG: hypothetical protein BWX71_02695 [Deltaproteobacteria bacterium ADurb.Bin072]|nr:MAG: hypothetical protein BWX71_02695 [Deltaproteobacteria bacterium ADurb.Bin072]
MTASAHSRDLVPLRSKEASASTVTSIMSGMTMGSDLVWVISSTVEGVNPLKVAVPPIWKAPVSSLPVMPSTVSLLLRRSAFPFTLCRRWPLKGRVQARSSRVMTAEKSGRSPCARTCDDTLTMPVLSERSSANRPSTSMGITPSASRVSVLLTSPWAWMSRRPRPAREIRVRGRFTRPCR